MGQAPASSSRAVSRGQLAANPRSIASSASDPVAIGSSLIGHGLALLRPRREVRRARFGWLTTVSSGLRRESRHRVPDAAGSP